MRTLLKILFVAVVLFTVFPVHHSLAEVDIDWERVDQIRAKKIDAALQFKVGLTYADGKGVPQDYKEAAKCFREAAELGHVGAQFILGTMYANGEGVKQDHKEAARWYREAAENGLAVAQFSLGNMYKNGKGVPQDYKEAAKWYQKAAELGQAGAQFILGAMYANGEGVTQDYREAVRWYRKAAEQGQAGAQFSLGNMYDDGKGVTQNDINAYVWSSLAAANGHKDAAHNRDIFRKRLTPNQLEEAQQLAAQLQRKIEQLSESSSTDTSTQSELVSYQLKGSGTGFIITKDGYVLTCDHVINDASSIKVIVDDNSYAAEVVSSDKYNDLALLKISGSFPALTFSAKRSAKMGQDVFTIGYPNPSLQGVSAKLTKGAVNSLTGFQDDLRLYQISAPVQPGNSGGPLLDMNGNIIGVIVSMLDAKIAFKITGELPQNVNYAIKSAYAQALLDSLPEVVDKPPQPYKAQSFDDVVERVKKSVVMVLSYE